MKKNKRPSITPDDARLLGTLIDRLDQILAWDKPFGFLKDSEAAYAEMLMNMFQRILAKSSGNPRPREDYEKNRRFFLETRGIMERFVSHPTLGKEYDRRRARGFLVTLSSLERTED